LNKTFFFFLLNHMHAGHHQHTRAKKDFFQNLFLSPHAGFRYDKAGLVILPILGYNSRQETAGARL
jgi:hypothetical protein